MKYSIIVGLGGSFGGARFADAMEFDTREEAEQTAWEMACEHYEGYVGLHGLREVGEIMEEDGADEDEAWEIYQEERESWITYYVKPYEEGDEE